MWLGALLDGESGAAVRARIIKESRFHIIGPNTVRPLIPRRPLTSWSETTADAPRDGTPVLVIADTFAAEFAMRKELAAAGIQNAGLFGSIAPAAAAAKDWGMLGRPGDANDRPGTNPEHLYVLFCPPRVGSGLLCSTLRDCGLGAPIEHVRGVAAVARAAGMPQPAFLIALEPYASRNRVFGTKLLIHAFAKGGATGSGPGLEPWRRSMQILTERGYKYFSLTRDPIDSAVSRTIAETTRIWHVDEGKLKHAQTAQAAADLDELALWGYLTRRVAQDIFFEQAVPLPEDQVFQYDDLVADPKAVAAAMANALGAPFSDPDRTGPLPARLSQDNPVYETWRQRAAELVLQLRAKTEEAVLGAVADATGLDPAEIRAWDNFEPRISALMDSAKTHLG